MRSAEVLAQRTGMSAACRTLSVPRSTLYRTRRQVQGIETPAIETPVVEMPVVETPVVEMPVVETPVVETPVVEMPVVETPVVETEASEEPPSSPRALTAEERGAVRDMLNSERFQNSAPRQVYATLLDEGEYLCGWRTMYRILDEHAEVRERRNQLRHPIYVKPELLATGPNQLWSWDITKLRGPERWVYYYLYAMLDVFSRYAVGWMVAEQEAADLAKLLIGESCTKQAILPGQLVIHADRGSPMIAKSVALLMADLERALPNAARVAYTGTPSTRPSKPSATTSTSTPCASPSPTARHWRSSTRGAPITPR